MKTIVAVIIHDRFKNLKEWIRCWKQCNTVNSELVIIHNFQTEKTRREYKEYCDDNAITYISRGNVGMDIGAFQDVCKGRLEGFPIEWDFLLWCTDDVLPMHKDFIATYAGKMREDIGVIAMELSKEVKLHIRTTGFMIKREIAEKLEFPAEPITTKTHCFEFEHLSKNAFYEQIRRMNKEVIQVIDDTKKAPLWDTHIRANYRRQGEHDQEFPIFVPLIEKKVIVTCPIYESFPQIISSLLCQTYQNWNLLLIHDGPNTTGLDKIVQNYNDRRIVYIETPERKGNWGHHLRKFAIDQMREGKLFPDADYIVVTNADNYYVPTFLYEMVKGFNGPNKVATYCSAFVHGYNSNQPDGTYKFGVLQTKLELGWVDCGGVMVRKDVACDVGWDSMVMYSDWEYFKNIITKYGEENWGKVLGCLFVHV